MGDVVMWFRRKEKPMVQFIKTAEERVAAALKEMEQAAFRRIVATFDDALHNIEERLVDEGLKLDQEAEDALAVLKHKLSDLKDKIV
jgi:uncharacterized protein YicC (UPF0701 family)